MEAGVDLVNIMRDEGFYVTQRTLSNGTASRTATDGGGAAFGRPVPIQLPTAREVEKDTEGFVSTITKLTSPVYYSTTEEGRVIRGLGGIPTTRPLLLVGNHQLFAAGECLRFAVFVRASLGCILGHTAAVGVVTTAVLTALCRRGVLAATTLVLLLHTRTHPLSDSLHQSYSVLHCLCPCPCPADMYPMIKEFVQELGVLPRGLAHPVVFAGPDALTAAGANGGMAQLGGGNSDPEDRAAGAMQFGNLLSTYGAVPVSGRNMHKLLEQGEMVLLYPGGAREVRRQRVCWLAAAVLLFAPRVIATAVVACILC